MFKNFKIKKVIRFLLITIIFLSALMIRFLLVPYAGCPLDIGCWQNWAKSINQVGIVNVYNEALINLKTIWPNYFPPYLYVLGIIGFIYQKFFSSAFELYTLSLIFLLKLPAIIFDLLTGFLIFFILRKQFKLNFTLSFFILIFYLFNPGLIYNSSYWGQIDSIHIFFILLSLYFLTKEKFSSSWIFLTIALFLKLQSIIFFPLLFFLNLEKKNYQNLFKNLGVALLTAAILCLPFILTGKIFPVIALPFALVSTHPYLSVNAFNFWWLPYSIKPLSSNDLFLGLIPYNIIGFSFFLLIYWFSLKNLFKKYSSKLVYLTSAFIAFSFFMLPCQIHERYLYPLFPLVILTLDKDKKLFLLYLFLSFTYFANLAAVSPFPGSSLFFNLSISSSWPIVFINILCFLYFFYYLMTYEKNSARSANL